MVSADQLYYKYGSRISSGVAAVLYDKITEDPALIQFFERVDTEAWHDHMSDLFSVLTGGPNLYKGRDLLKVHGPFSINDEEFDRVLGHMRASLMEMGASEEEAQSVTALIEARRGEIVTA